MLCNLTPYLGVEIGQIELRFIRPKLDFWSTIDQLFKLDLTFSKVCRTPKSIFKSLYCIFKMPLLIKFWRRFSSNKRQEYCKLKIVSKTNS